MSDTDVIQIERVGDVLEVALDRPAAYNAIDPELRNALASVFDGAEEQGARAILLRGNGRGFCSGADLRAARPAKPGVAVAQRMRMSTQLLVRSYLDCPVPVVAAVHGTTAGIGLTLAWGADVCIAAADARFLPAFLQRAIVPDGGIAWWLPRVIGLARTKQFLLQGQPMSAIRAEELGLIARTADPDDLLDVARAEAQRLAKLPTITVSLVKQMLSQSFDTDLATTLLAERNAQGLSSATDDAAEGIRSFLEKRDPDYVGH